MEDLVDVIAVGFMFLVDVIKRFKYLIIVTLIALGLMYWVWSVDNDAKQECRDKGGVPISADSGVKCATGVIK
jgi:hypothetical protein